MPTTIQLPFGPAYAGHLAASGRRELTGFRNSIRGLEELFRQRPHLKPTDSNFGDWPAGQLALFEKNGTLDEPNPLELIINDFPFEELAEEAKQVVVGLDKSDSARGPIGSFVSACESVAKWAPNSVEVTVRAKERKLKVRIYGEPDDLVRIQGQLCRVESLDELTEVALKFQRELAEKYHWEHTDATDCCGSPGYVVPESTALSEQMLGRLAVVHEFHRPSDVERPVGGVNIIVLGGENLPDGMSIQSLLEGLFGGSLPPGFELPGDDDDEHEDEFGL